MMSITLKSMRDIFRFLIATMIMMVMSRIECVAMADARTDPVELQAVYAMMAATGNAWATSIPDVCVKSGRWRGIECAQDGEFFHVVGLSFGLVTDHTGTAFPACGAYSTISPAVANLTHLRRLSYFACCTANPQPIPREIGLLSATLETLHLRSNGHIGALPPELASLAQLRSFDVHGNSLSGTMPAWLSSLAELQVVDMSDNAFQGDFASFSNDLEKLVILDASSNRLAGALPDSISQLKALKKLDLSNNSLTGAIPATMSDLRNLLSLNLAHNAITGPLPSSLGVLADLKSLNLGGNRFGAPIPHCFGSLRSLEELVLSSAEFTGAIPSELGALRNLKALFLDGNKLTGAIPHSLVGLDRVYELELSGNLLCGPVPFSESFVSRLGRRLRLDNNGGLCYEFQAAKSLTPSARPAAPLPLLQICRSNVTGDQRADVRSWDPERPSPITVPSTRSWNPALDSSSSCSKTSAFQAARHISRFSVVFIVIVSRWT